MDETKERLSEKAARKSPLLINTKRSEVLLALHAIRFALTRHLVALLGLRPSNQNQDAPGHTSQQGSGDSSDGVLIRQRRAVVLYCRAGRKSHARPVEDDLYADTRRHPRRLP
jgi:hypothetical protein